MPIVCQACGCEHSTYVLTCPRCGRSQPLTQPDRPSNNPADPEFPPIGPRGVGGWLLFLCISLTFFGPVIQATIGLKVLRNLATQRVPVETVLRLGSVGAIYTGLAIFSCFAGIMLWMENPRGPHVAKAYLLVALVLPIGLHVVLTMFGLHFNLLQITIRRVFYSVLWFAYLSTSRRVKLTYGVR